MIPSRRKPCLTSTISLFTVLILAGGGCASVKKVALEFDTQSILRQSEVFSQHHVGFSLFDTETNEFISTYNAGYLYTPASNTKLLTMYAVLSSFSDSIPSLLYQQVDSGLLVEPLGDPTFLLKDFDNQASYDLLSSASNIAIRLPSNLTIYGSGWAWDDFHYAFQTQRSWWPLYGNRVWFSTVDSTLMTNPPFFQEFTEYSTNDSAASLGRELQYNSFQVNVPDNEKPFEGSVPYIYSDELLMKLLSDTLPNSSISFVAEGPANPDTLYSQPVDLVLQKMLKPSDNFLAEQLLLLSARENGFREINPYIEQLRTVELSTLGDMVWVDGSGLSRYNLISPNDQVRLLKKCLDDFGWERMTRLLPTGGEGTLENLYESDQNFIYAKTGTLSNNHNLSGYLITKSGKRLIFSLMNNHYTRPTTEITEAMEAFILEIRNAY